MNVRFKIIHCARSILGLCLLIDLFPYFVANKLSLSLSMTIISVRFLLHYDTIVASKQPEIFKIFVIGFGHNTC